MNKPAVAGPAAWWAAAVAGWVDTAYFLHLDGVFTAHVTGNFVLAGAAVVRDELPTLRRLLALPWFALVVAATAVAQRGAGLSTRRLAAWWLAEATLLAAAAAVAIASPTGAGVAGDAVAALAVAAMAVQNTLGRLQLAHWPATTVMTGNVTSLVIDLVAVAGPKRAGDPAAPARRWRDTGAVVVAFATGAVAGGTSLHYLGPVALLFAALGAIRIAALVARSPVS